MPKSKNQFNASRKIDESPSQRNIIFITDQDNAHNPYIEAFEHQSFILKPALYNGKTLSNIPKVPPAAIVCFLKVYEEKSENIAAIVKSHYGLVHIPMIAISSKATTHQNNVFDNIIIGPAHPKQIANRVEAYLRFGAMEQEINLRKATLEQNFGSYIPSLEEGQTPAFRILFIGKASPSFMVIMHALKENNVEVTAAFTSFSAFDYLHETAFDAVVMNAVEEADPSIAIIETMRRNSRLFHVPALFVTRNDDSTYRDRAHQKGATDFIDVNSDPAEISRRILELAKYHRLYKNLKETFQRLGDEVTLNNLNACYNHDFMDKHAKRVVKTSKDTDQTISFIGLKLHPQCSSEVVPSRIKTAFTDIGKTLKSLVRLQDTVSFYAPDIYLLMLSDTRYDEAEIIVERISALLNCTAFESGTTQSPLTMALSSCIAEVEESETSDDTLKRVFSSLGQNSTETMFQDIA